VIWVINSGSTGMMIPKPIMSISTTRKTKVMEAFTALGDSVFNGSMIMVSVSKCSRKSPMAFVRIFIVSRRRFTYMNVND
jgi:hypothetical protein